MRLPILFASLSMVVVMTACGSREHTGSTCTQGVHAQAGPGSSGGISLPADFPDDVHRPSFAYSVVDVHQQTEMHLHSNATSEQSLADFTASLQESGWRFATTESAVVGGGPRSLRKGCRIAVVTVGTDPVKGGSAILLRTFDNSYQGCLSLGNDNQYPSDGDQVRLSGQPFADIRMPASLQLVDRVQQQTIVTFLVDASVDAVVSDYEKALAASCWDMPSRASHVSQTVQGTKGDRSLVVFMHPRNGGTEVVLNLN